MIKGEYPPPDHNGRQTNRRCLLTTDGLGNTDASANSLGDIPVPEAYVAVLRETPYTWTSWLAKLLIAENSCEWAIWFKAHY